jgi:hypothetical protein
VVRHGMAQRLNTFSVFALSVLALFFALNFGLQNGERAVIYFAP